MRHRPLLLSTRFGVASPPQVTTLRRCPSPKGFLPVLALLARAACLVRWPTALPFSHALQHFSQRLPPSACPSRTRSSQRLPFSHPPRVRLALRASREAQWGLRSVRLVRHRPLLLSTRFWVASPPQGTTLRRCPSPKAQRDRSHDDLVCELVLRHACQPAFVVWECGPSGTWCQGSEYRAAIFEIFM